ncbi:MAG: hypothetical protein HRU35_05510 [Rickettsiaceae bacterium]|nr:hypothetical protein [Rickettsiaceae bacterium]
MKLQKIASFSKEKNENKQNSLKKYSSVKQIQPLLHGNSNIRNCFTLSLKSKNQEARPLPIAYGNIIIIGDITQISHLTDYLLSRCPVPMKILGKNFDTISGLQNYEQVLSLITLDITKTPFKAMHQAIRNSSTAFIFHPFKNVLIRKRFDRLVLFSTAEERLFRKMTYLDFVVISSGKAEIAKVPPYKG